METKNETLASRFNVVYLGLFYGGYQEDIY
jgi:hypothetical protein